MEGGQCKACGRFPKDWGEGREKDRDAQGHKAVFKGDSGFEEDRTAAYRKWRYSFGRGIWAMDVDQVEWRRDENGEPRVVATIELTRVDGNVSVPPTYLQKILDRFDDRDFQAEHSRYVARALGVPCFIVAFRWDLSEFWVYNLSEKRERGWWHLDRRKFEVWQRSMTAPVGTKLEVI